MEAIEKLFSDLESNNLQRADDAKQRFWEHFSQTKESWLVNGMMDYFAQTNSSRIVDVLVKVQPPHDKYIFDRLCDWLPATAQRQQAISLFGHIVKKHPSWLYKVATHSFLRDLLRLLRTDTNIITTMHALFCLIILLPIIPTAMPAYLGDLFDAFLYLAAWNCHLQPRLTDDQAIHLQIGLAAYFQRLYGMYPCNFVAYLREHVMKDQPAVFAHTIRPLFEMVKMHPALLTSTRDAEKASGRWKEMEPHDVVVECARFALDYNARSGGGQAAAAATAGGGSGSSTTETGTDCVYYPMMSGRPIVETPISQQLLGMLKSTPTPASALCSPFYSPFSEPLDSARDPQRIDNIWSPLWNVMATPPPTLGGSGAPPTPTPAAAAAAAAAAASAYTIKPISSSNLCVSGSSPPEAAVEATPETTPMKEMLGSVGRPYPVNSPAVRAIWGQSQPTSPLRRDTATAFRFGGGSTVVATGLAETPSFATMQQQPTAAATSLAGSKFAMPTIASPKILSFVAERSAYASQLSREAAAVATATAAAAAAASTATGSVRGGVATATSSTPLADSTPEDAEVTQINSLARPPLPPQARFKRSPNGNSDDETTAAASAAALDDEVPLATDDSAADSPTTKARRLLTKRSAFAQKAIDRITIGTQTIEQMPHTTYDRMFVELQAGTSDSRAATAAAAADAVASPTAAAVPMTPHALLDQLMETYSMRSPTASAGNKFTASNPEQIQLLQLQLQFERYRREMHAERNRRLLGKSRVNAALEMDNEKLREQRDKLAVETDELTAALNRARVQRTGAENEHAAELQRLQHEGVAERARCAELRAHVEALRLDGVAERTKLLEAIGALAACKAEMFDMRNELAQTRERAELGARYKEDVNRLQQEVLLMGEIQVKCRERLLEVGTWETREMEAAMVRQAYLEECKDVRATLDTRTYQLDTARARLAELEAQLARRDTMFTDQKRLLKTVKEEYQDRFRALETKYTVQKAIIVRLEEEMLELHHRQQMATSAAAAATAAAAAAAATVASAGAAGAAGAEGGGLATVGGAGGMSAQGVGVGAAQQTPDMDRLSVVGSLDHASPLSMSLASSEGLAISLRSTATEIRNLHPLITANASFAALSTTSSASSAADAVAATTPSDQQPAQVVAFNSESAIAEAAAASVIRPAVSEDIPVPSAANNNSGVGGLNNQPHHHHHLQQQQLLRGTGHHHPSLHKHPHL